MGLGCLPDVPAPLVGDLHHHSGPGHSAVEFGVESPALPPSAVPVGKELQRQAPPALGEQQSACSEGSDRCQDGGAQARGTSALAQRREAGDCYRCGRFWAAGSWQEGLWRQREPREGKEMCLVLQEVVWHEVPGAGHGVSRALGTGSLQGQTLVSKGRAGPCVRRRKLREGRLPLGRGPAHRPRAKSTTAW